VADDPRTPPAPRPRRRRTDIDPNAPSPPVANERRRRKGGAATPNVATDDPATSDQWASVAARLVEHATPVDAGGAEQDTTPQFHVPGHAAAVATAPEATETPRESVDSARSWLARLDDRSPDPNVCPFLRAAADGNLGVPFERPDPANRCAALAEAVPQSLRQQELVCLTSSHVNCPRYLRGAAVIMETPRPVVRSGRTVTTPMFASLVLLVMAVSASIAFGMARGFSLTGVLPSPSATSIAAVSSPSAVAVASPSAAASTAVPSETIAATPSALPTPSATPIPTPTPTPATTPKSDRYKLLKACGDAPRCWIYTVRSGDNLYSIARYFGVSMDSIYARNTWLRNTHLRAGQQLRLPPPTR
jgi:LysM domain-containing protein